MATFEEQQNEWDKTLEKEVRGKTSKELQALLANPLVGSSLKEAIKAELDIRLSKATDDLNSSMSSVEKTVDELNRNTRALNISTTKYNRWLIGLSIIIAILTLVYTLATIAMLVKMFVGRQ